MLSEAKNAWEALAPFRKNRDRCRDYTFGRQWNDIINVDGKFMTEYDYILREGNIPLKNNLIRRIVRNVLGVFRKELPAMMKGYDGELAEISRLNSLPELLGRTMEEFLISGMAVHRKSFGLRNGRSGVFTDIVSPASFFFNTSARDIRGWDINLAGQIHDVSFHDWCAAFVKDKASYDRARSFFKDKTSTVRVTEIWRREFRPRMLVHDRRRAILRKIDLPASEDNPDAAKTLRPEAPVNIEHLWRYYFLTEEGEVLAEGDSPYRHGSHPYVVKCYPYLDGEIQSFVGDMIDQQRYANRLITLYDWVMRASAKGVLLLPEGAVAPDNLQAVADQWSRFNGVIVYKARPGIPDPHQVNAANANMGISELLDIQLKMLEDVSGVNGVLQGNLSSNSVSGTLFNQQTENARTSLSDILDTFRSFIEAGCEKDLALLNQTSS